MDFLSDFDNYFNHVLRDALGYPEKFQIIIEKSRITLIPDSPSQLLQIIKTNRRIKENILLQITLGLKNSIYFSTHGTDIIIEIERKKILVNLDTGVYANIMSLLDDKTVNNFCLVFPDTCKKSDFWSEMLKQRFPQYYLEGVSRYNWEKVYKGLLWYEGELSYKDYIFSKFKIENITDIYSKQIAPIDGVQVYKVVDRIMSLWLHFIKGFSITLNYLIENKLITLSQSDMLIIISLNGDYDKIKLILDNYGLINYTLNSAFNFYIHRKEIAMLFLNYKKIDPNGNVVKLTKNDIMKMLRFEANNRLSQVTIEDLNYYQDIANKMEN